MSLFNLVKEIFYKHVMYIYVHTYIEYIQSITHASTHTDISYVFEEDVLS